MFITVFTTVRTRPCITFRNKLAFYGEELLAHRSTLKLEDHPVSVVDSNMKLSNGIISILIIIIII
jgi:hypothetical protein